MVIAWATLWGQWLTRSLIKTDGDILVLTIQQMITALSKYTVGPGGDITSEELAVLREVVAGELSRLDPGFVANDRLRLEAYLILNAYESEDTGIKQERIKDHTWTYTDTSSGSHWMDAALLFINSFRSQEMLDFGGVERCDAEMRSMASDRIKPETFGTVDTNYTRQEWDQDYA